MLTKEIVQQSLDLFPGLVYYAKDKNYIYRYTNKYLCQVLGFESGDCVLGRNDYELPHKSEADKYIEQDKYSLMGNHQFNIDTPLDNNGFKKVLLIKKFPLYKNNSDLAGVAGIGFHLTKDNFSSMLSSIALPGLKLTDFSSELSNLKTDEFIYDKISFSKREAQILSNLLKGHSAASIGNLLHLSRRTVEHYIERIKENLNCKNKAEIINKAFELGFIDLMFLKI